MPCSLCRDRIDPFFFKFQYKNVEYSSGRNKTFLCYLVHEVRGQGDETLLRGYLEDEHSGSDHSEDAFFHLVLPHYEASAHYTVTWYVSSSPCPSCTSKLAEILRERQTLRLTIFSARLFEWEEPEVRAGLKLLAGAGCKLRMMKPLDFSYTWDTFVEHDSQRFEPWEDCQENYEYYQDKLAEILQWLWEKHTHRHIHTHTDTQTHMCTKHVHAQTSPHTQSHIQQK